MTDWQPIETALKDGTRILMAFEWFGQRGVEMCHWYERDGNLPAGWSLDGGTMGDSYKLLGWMPVPEPPA